MLTTNGARCPRVGTFPTTLVFFFQLGFPAQQKNPKHLWPGASAPPLLSVPCADVERILGKRPFTSSEMRNIDHYRHGMGSEPAPEDAAQQSPPAPPAGGDSPGGPPPPPSGPALPAAVQAAAKAAARLRLRIEPGSVVAT